MHLQAPSLRHRLALALVDLGKRYRLGSAFFTTDFEAEALIQSDPFAFLLGLIFDQSVDAEKAWRAPFGLRGRLGTLDPEWIGNNEKRVTAAIGRRPSLHRFTNTMGRWISSAGREVVSRFGGDASRIWNDEPTAVELQDRLHGFLGIGQKKAAMAVEILERQFGVVIRDLKGSDVAFDVHVRRVFLRTGLADRDDRDEIIAAARDLYPQRPGAIDYGAWRLGRSLCRARNPSCDECPLEELCPQYIERGDAVHVT